MPMHSSIKQTGMAHQCSGNPTELWSFPPKEYPGAITAEYHLITATTAAKKGKMNGREDTTPHTHTVGFSQEDTGK